jgi:hypothetical protein
VPSMKKRTPHNPAKPAPNLHGHLGVPNEHRQAHSRSGFDTEALADSRFVSRERAMLTHPALLTDLYNEVMRKLAESGEPVPEHIHISKMTPSDRVSAAYRNLLWAYLRVRAEVVRGTIKAADYEGAPVQRQLNQVPLSQSQFDARRLYAWIREQHGLMVVTDFLDSIVLQLNPELAGDGETAPTKADIGKGLIGIENARDAKTAADGALALACRVLSEAARDFVIIERRYRDEANRLSRQRIGVAPRMEKSING